jgi:hypothetical protein
VTRGESDAAADLPARHLATSRGSPGGHGRDPAETYRYQVDVSR